MVESELDFRITRDTPYLALTGEIWGVYCEDIGENWPRYNGIAPYMELARESELCDVCFKDGSGLYLYERRTACSILYDWSCYHDTLLIFHNNMRRNQNQSTYFSKFESWWKMSSEMNPTHCGLETGLVTWSTEYANISKLERQPITWPNSELTSDVRYGTVYTASREWTMMS